MILIYLPFSHFSPSKPGGQTQVVFATPSMHVPPFKHGKNISVPFDNAAISGSLVQHLEYLHLSIFNEEKKFWNALTDSYILYLLKKDIRKMKFSEIDLYFTNKHVL